MVDAQKFSKAAQRRCQMVYGCDLETLHALNDGQSGGTRGSAAYKYRQLKWMAEEHGAQWDMTFPEWKGVWDASGKWNERGLKQGKYIMRRIDMKLPHSVNNVQIVLCAKDDSKPPKPSPLEKLATDYGVDAAHFKSVVHLSLVRRRYREQRMRARARDIAWTLTFADWWGIWKESGLWDKRGRDGADAAVMARNGDTGPYSKDNVRIISLAENFAEYWGSQPEGICRANVGKAVA